MTATAVTCPVCRSPGPLPLLSTEGRDYWRCPNCEARFLDPRHLPSQETERAYYGSHENDPHDPGYRRFLSKLVEPLLARLQPGARGLDYGCGPGPALAAMLREAGHRMALYDPCFHPDPAPLACRYDFVACSETAEHFHRPAAEFARLTGLVRPGGWLERLAALPNVSLRLLDGESGHADVALAAVAGGLFGDLIGELLEQDPKVG